MNLKMPKSGELFLQLDALREMKNTAVKKQDYEAAAGLREDEKKLKRKFDELQKEETPFHVDTFNRELFKKTLSQYVVLSASEIIDAVDASLRNVGIRSEIDTAIKVYERAKRVISIASNTLMDN